MTVPNECKKYAIWLCDVRLYGYATPNLEAIGKKYDYNISLCG